jgi:hypothetical protein
VLARPTIGILEKFSGVAREREWPDWDNGARLVRPNERRQRVDSGELGELDRAGLVNATAARSRAPPVGEVTEANLLRLDRRSVTRAEIVLWRTMESNHLNGAGGQADALDDLAQPVAVAAWVFRPQPEPRFAVRICRCRSQSLVLVQPVDQASR